MVLFFLQIKLFDRSTGKSKEFSLKALENIAPETLEAVQPAKEPEPPKPAPKSRKTFSLHMPGISTNDVFAAEVAGSLLDLAGVISVTVEKVSAYLNL